MENIAAIVIGVLFIFIGVGNCRGKLSMLHSYHQKRVREEDRPIFGKLVGSGIITVGVALILMGTFTLLADRLQMEVCRIIGTALLITGLVVGLGISFFAMIKYNKGIF